MTCPPFTALLSGDKAALAHAAGCAKCKQALDAIQIVRKPPPGGAEFRRQVLLRLHEKRSMRWVWLAPVAAAAAVVLLWQTPEFAARGGKEQPVLVEIVAQGGGYAVRVKNHLDHDVWIGAYLKDAASETHWLAPHYPTGASPPQLVRVPAGTELHLLDTGVVPEQPAKGKAELVGFAVAAPARIETDPLQPFFEHRVTIEVP